MDHVFSLVRLGLEVRQILLHRLQRLKVQNVGEVVHGDVDEQRSHFVWKMSVDAVVRFRGIGFGREIVEVGLERGRGDVEMARQHHGEQREDTHDDRGCATEGRRRPRKAFFEVRLIHGQALPMEHKNQQVRCGHTSAASTQNNGTVGQEGSKQEGRSQGRLSWLLPSF